VNEAQSSEVERVLLHISDARERTRRAVARVEKEDPDADVVGALLRAQEDLGELHRRLTQGTYYAVRPTRDQLAL
jgi:hypothetical protein